MKARIIFNRRKSLNTKGEGLLEFQLYLTRTKRPIRSTGLVVPEKYWDEENERLKKGFPEADRLNALLQIKRNEFENEFLSEYLKTGSKHAISIKKTLFYDFFENFVIKVANANISEGTQKIYRRTLRYLKEFAPKDFPIEEVNVMFMEKFNVYLKENKKLAQNSRASLVSKIKKVLNQAIKHDLMKPSENPFNKGFTVTEIIPEPNSLSLEELKSIEDLDMTLRPELIVARDMFLLQCYTSMRYGDLTSLAMDNFSYLPDNKIRLSYIPNKTRKINGKRVTWIVSEFWNGKIDRIIEKYQDKEGVLFTLSNVNYNRQLKELQRFAGIKQKIYSHLGRNTCITLLVNDFRMDVTKVQKIAGHSKIEMTMRYLRITERDLSAAASNVDWEI